MLIDGGVLLFFFRVCEFKLIQFFNDIATAMHVCTKHTFLRFLHFFFFFIKSIETSSVIYFYSFIIIITFLELYFSFRFPYNK